MRRIRKQVYDLTPQDLTRFPVWVFALDEEGEPGQDEATVRPWEEPLPFDPGEGLNVVRVDFWLADETHAIGYISAQVPDFSGISYIQPTIVTPGGQVGFWCGVMKPDAERLRDAYALLEKDKAQVFPVRYESAVELTTGKVMGTIEGFLHFRSISDHTVKLVT